jgi:threonine dehydrogenase-like Zn-dependent dehydrogenase
VDLAPLRLRLAAAGGATACIEGSVGDRHEALLAASGGDGFDVVVDTTGNPAVFAQALGVAGMFGKLVLLGDTGYPSRQSLTSDVMTKGLTIVATHDHHDRGGWTQRRIDALFFRLVRNGSFALDGLITHEFPPEACEDAYSLASGRRDEAVGILFDWARSGDGSR